MKMSSKQFVLILWVEDNPQKVSIEPAEAVIGENPDGLQVGTFYKSIQWRGGRNKAPRDGFPVYPGKILGFGGTCTPL